MRRVPTYEELAAALDENLKDLKDVPKTQLKFFINLTEIYAQMYRVEIATTDNWEDVLRKQGIVSGIVMLNDTIRSALAEKEAQE